MKLCNYIVVFVDTVIFILYKGSDDDYKNTVYNFSMKAYNADGAK